MKEDYIIVQCKNCGKKYKVKNPENPKRYRCGNCQNLIIVEPRLTKVYEDNSKQLYLRIKDNGKKHIGLRNAISLHASHLKFWDRVIISFVLCFIIFIGFIWLASKFINKPSSPTIITNLEKSKPSSSLTNENKKLQESRPQSKIDWKILANNLIRDYHGKIISVEQINSSTCWVVLSSDISNYQAVKEAENIGYYIRNVSATMMGKKVWEGVTPSVHVFKGRTHIAVAHPNLDHAYNGKLDIKNW